MNASDTEVAGAEREEVVLDADLLQALDRYAREQGPGTSRADALREALDALAPHLARYRRSVEAYAAALDDDR